MTQTITAMYDAYTDATAAKAKLVAIGIPERTPKSRAS